MTLGMQAYLGTLSIVLVPLCITVVLIVIGYISNYIQDKAYFKIKTKEKKNAPKKVD
jgi:ABC-type siderophore export system fused ATPase/permease subunit